MLLKNDDYFTNFSIINEELVPPNPNELLRNLLILAAFKFMENTYKYLYGEAPLQIQLFHHSKQNQFYIDPF